MTEWTLWVPTVADHVIPFMTVPITPVMQRAPCPKPQIISNCFLKLDTDFTGMWWDCIMNVQPINLQQLCDAIMSLWEQNSNLSEWMWHSHCGQGSCFEFFRESWYTGTQNLMFCLNNWLHLKIKSVSIDNHAPPNAGCTINKGDCVDFAEVSLSKTVFPVSPAVTAPPVQQVAVPWWAGANNPRCSVIQDVCALKDAADGVKVHDKEQVRWQCGFSRFVWVQHGAVWPANEV